MDIRKEIALNNEISRIICKPGHTYNEITKRCYPVVGKSGDMPTNNDISANDAVNAEIMSRKSARLTQ